MDRKGNRQHIANRRYYTAFFVSSQFSLRENMHKRVSVIPVMLICHHLSGSSLHMLLLFVPVLSEIIHFYLSLNSSKHQGVFTFQTELEVRFAAIPASILSKSQFTMCPAYALLSIITDPSEWEG